MVKKPGDKDKTNVVYLKDRLGKWVETIRHDDPVTGCVFSLRVNHTTQEFEVMMTDSGGNTMKVRVNRIVGVLVYECLRKLFGFASDTTKKV